MINKKMFVNGQWTEALSGRTRDIINPFNREGIARVSEGDREDAKRAVKAASVACGPVRPAKGSYSALPGPGVWSDRR